MQAVKEYIKSQPLFLPMWYSWKFLKSSEKDFRGEKAALPGGEKKLLVCGFLRLESKSPAAKSGKMKNPQDRGLARQEEDGSATLLLVQ